MFHQVANTPNLKKSGYAVTQALALSDLARHAEQVSDGGL